MNRRHYLVAYDISDDKARTRVFEILRDHGDRAQYSVFFCDLDLRELAELEGRVAGHINHATDQVMFLDIGPDTKPVERFTRCVGRPLVAPSRVRIV